MIENNYVGFSGTQRHKYCSDVTTKTNHPISSNSNPSATAVIAIHCLKRGGNTKPTGKILCSYVL